MHVSYRSTNMLWLFLLPTVVAQECPAGKIPSEPCVSCPSGKFSVNITCVDCPVGYYQTEIGQSRCYSCGKLYAGFKWVDAESRDIYSVACDQYKECVRGDIDVKDCSDHAFGRSESGYGHYWRKCCVYQQNYFHEFNWFSSNYVLGDEQCTEAFKLTGYTRVSSGLAGLLSCNPPTYGINELKT